VCCYFCISAGDGACVGGRAAQGCKAPTREAVCVGSHVSLVDAVFAALVQGYATLCKTGEACAWRRCLSPPSSSGLGESWLFPEDLAPFTRRPLLLVVDSEHARAFRCMANRERSYPACCLMSPPAQPPDVRDLKPHSMLKASVKYA